MDIEFTDRQQFKLEEFQDFVTMDMYPIQPKFVLGYRNQLHIQFERDNQHPPDTLSQITVDLNMVFDNDILVSRDLFNKVYAQFKAGHGDARSTTE